MNGDFATAMALATKGDTVYCDPPYVDTSTTSSFTAYTSGAFDIQQQEAVVDVARAAATRGARVVISNHDTVQTRQLYAGMEIHSFDARRSVAATADARKPMRELIAVLEPA